MDNNTTSTLPPCGDCRRPVEWSEEWIPGEPILCPYCEGRRHDFTHFLRLDAHHYGQDIERLDAVQVEWSNPLGPGAARVKITFPAEMLTEFKLPRDLQSLAGDVAHTLRIGWQVVRLTLGMVLEDRSSAVLVFILAGWGESGKPA